ncbi:MAG: RNA polymerase sigma-54 factor [bacterium]|nr:MAG: RNA polymerase sigma-54 factor [bacterium]
MSIKPNLVTSLRQQLVLTPQMRQRIELLGMTSLEMQDLLQTEMVENPVLEVDENGPGENSESLSTIDESLYAADNPQPPMAEVPSSEVTPGENKSPSEASFEEADVEAPDVNPDPFQEIDFGSTFEEYLDPGYKTHEYEQRERPSFENMITRPLTLAEHLIWQLNMSGLSGETREAAEAVIGNLNDDGYLDATLDEIMEMGDWPLSVVEKARHTVQTFEPVGVGSLERKECLLIQLEQLGYSNRLAAKLVGSYLDRLQPYRLPDLAKELGISLEHLRAEMEIIRKLEPYPGRKYATKNTHYIEPEVYIEKIDDEYYIHFNDDGMPQLRINSAYRRMLEGGETTKETRDYIKNRFRSAVDLLKNIEHRKQTIYKVCESIVRRQREFLDRGVEYIRPMMLKDIAEDIEMHLSTVSRVVNGKYAHTPQGVIELRRFFTEGMTNDDGEEVSTRVIKLQIKKMIEMEDVRNPLTDEDIAERLAKEGMKMSRRTVAKYRDQMSIPGSRERRIVE